MASHIWTHRLYARGALTLESGTGMCRGHGPLFSGQSALLSLPIYHQCAAHVSPIFNFRKNCIFKPCFGQNFSYQVQFLQIVAPKALYISRKIRSLDPTFRNPCGTHPPKKKKKKLSAPPPPRGLDAVTTIQLWFMVSFTSMCSKMDHCHPGNLTAVCSIIS